MDWLVDHKNLRRGADAPNPDDKPLPNDLSRGPVRHELAGLREPGGIGVRLSSYGRSPQLAAWRGQAADLAAAWRMLAWRARPDAAACRGQRRVDREPAA